MDEAFRRSLAQRARDRVPAGDPFHVGSTALPALAARNEERAARLGRRADRFSQLVARSASHEFVKDKLVAKSALSEEDRAEAFAVASSALAEFDGEIVRLMAELRSMLSELDPIVTTAHISCNHIVTPWGDGYEPTGEGSEAAVEIVGSIFASQPSESTRQPASADIQAIEDTLVAIADVQMLRGLAAAMADSEPVSYTHLTLPTSDLV